MQIILASQSPRRQELLKRVVPAFTIAPADIDETVGKDGLPAEYVAQMAAQKAAAIAEQSRSTSHWLRYNCGIGGRDPRQTDFSGRRLSHVAPPKWQNT